MLNNKILYSVIGLLSFTDVAHSAIYQCIPCKIGTYSDGTKLGCDPCPDGYVCPAGTGKPIPVANCSKVLIGTYSSGSGTKDIFTGIYLIEVAGGGGGGGGGGSNGNGLKCKWHYGGTGGKGAKVEKIVYATSDLKYTYSVGSGGSGGGGGNAGGTGGTSKFTLSDNSTNVSAAGGSGGAAGHYDYTGANGKNAGNGGGGCGGSPGGRSGGGLTCKKASGSGGCAGWVKVYQLGNCKL